MDDTLHRRERAIARRGDTAAGFWVSGFLGSVAAFLEFECLSSANSIFRNAVFWKTKF